MNNMPDWLWPSDDEQAVREAELLIAETQQTLQRMELKMQKQDRERSGKNAGTTKVKNEVDSKINSLEKELRSISVAAGHTRAMVPHTRSTLPHSRHHPKIQIPKSNAESVVKTVHDKVQGALSVARHVSASLDLHTPRQSLRPTAMMKQVSLDKKRNTLKSKGSCESSDTRANVKILEVKSHSVDQKEMVLNERRLQQSHLPVISIKRPLECQNIPAIHVPPTNKRISTYQAQNVAVHHFQYQQPSQAQDSQVLQSHESKVAHGACEEQCVENNRLRNGQQLESVLSNLSAQLSQIEELRELNQTQVNHVLRFLLARVCAPPVSHPTERKSTTDIKTDKKSIMSKGHSSSSPPSSRDSDCGRPRIAYDSLSRFLETYRQAAQQSMRASQKASIQRKNIARKQRKDVKLCKQSAANHLLIGPLRRAVIDDDTHLLGRQNDQPSNSSSESNVEQSSTHSNSHSCKVGGIHGSNTESTHTSMLSIIADDDCDSSVVSSNPANKHDSALIADAASDVTDKDRSVGTADGSFDKSPDSVDLKNSKIGEDSYEDDWEEDDTKENPQDQVQDSQVAPSLRTIIEAEESFTSSSHSEQAMVQPSASVEERAVHNFSGQNEDDEQPPAVDSHQMSATDSNQAFVSKIKLDATPTLGEHFNLEMERLAQQHFSEGKNSKPKENIPQTEIPTYHNTPCNNSVGNKISQAIERNSESDRSNGMSTGPDTNAGLSRRLNTTTQTQTLSDLHLHDDLQLRSSMLLNWSLEDEWKKRFLKERGQRVALEDFETRSTVTANVDEQWKKIVSDLEKRIQAIEEQERINHAVQEHRLRTIEEQERIRQLLEQEKIKCSLNEHNHVFLSKKEEERAQREKLEQEKANQVMLELELLANATQNLQLITKKASSSKVRDQEVQTSDMTDGRRTSSDPTQAATFIPATGRSAASDQRWLHFLKNKSDLTDQLLSYGQMGVIPKLGASQESSVSCSASSASSVRSLFSLQVSLSDGELRASGTGSCSCSEGEVCNCRRLQTYGERAPPDGSQAFSVGEQFIKDMSQGELALYVQDKDLKDISQGELALSEHIIEAESTLNDIQIGDLSSGSAETDWESEHRLRPLKR